MTLFDAVINAKFYFICNFVLCAKYKKKNYNFKLNLTISGFFGQILQL